MQHVDPYHVTLCSFFLQVLETLSKHETDGAIWGMIWLSSHCNHCYRPFPWHFSALSSPSLCTHTHLLHPCVKPAAGLRAHLTEGEGVRSEACHDTRSDS